MEPIARVAIVGYGLIGGSIGLALRERAPHIAVVPIDIADSLSAADGADLIVLAAPISENIRILETIAGHVSGHALMTDTGSTKAETVWAAERLPERLRFIGGHPIAGGTGAGFDTARPDLFFGKPWILTPARGIHGDDLDALTTFVEELGATVHLMDAIEHDRVLAYTSHLPQLAASAVMHVVGQTVGEAGLKFAGSGLRDTTRLAASPASIWRDIVASNRQNATRALDDLIGALQELRRQGGDDAVERIFADAARWKRQLDAD